jgi:hypothetical protein
MGLFTGLLLLPLAPIRGNFWISAPLPQQPVREADPETVIRRLLLEAEAELEEGRLTEAEFDQIEDELLERLERANEEVLA